MKYKKFLLFIGAILMAVLLIILASLFVGNHGDDSNFPGSSSVPTVIDKIAFLLDNAL